MAGIERFEEIEGWKEARNLTKAIYQVTRLSAFNKDIDLRQQMRRASVSIMANIAEGFDASSNREFAMFLGYALRSGTEIQSHLYVAFDQGYVDQRTFDSLRVQTVQVKGLIGGFVRYLRSHSRSRGRAANHESLDTLR
jgi:four helix bundle protein